MSRMRMWSRLLLLLAVSLFFPSARAADSAKEIFVGWTTNGPGVYRLRFLSTQVLPGMPVSYCPPPSDLPAEVRRAMLTFKTALNVRRLTNTEPVFDHFLVESIDYLVWTNFIAHTNDRNMLIWSERKRPTGLLSRAPVVKWNTNSLMWGLKGLTAICPYWEGEGPPGWTPITALTRRHGYTRGHGMGPEREGTDFAGKRVWFLTTQNSLVETKVLRNIVRTREASGRDYTIFLFSSDLPDSIQPMRVLTPEDTTKRLQWRGGPHPIFETEQGGNVSAEVPGFKVNTYKGGDSGSPNMVPLPGELAFWNGRTTSGASPEMQADMDKLCRLENLDPSKYQMQWIDLSAYPEYSGY